MARTINDLGTWFLGELEGREPRGSVERYIAAETGTPTIGEAPAGKLLELAKALGSPQKVQDLLSGLKKAQEDEQLERTALEADLQLVKKAKADLERSRADYEAEMARQLAEHRAAVAVAQDELATAKETAGKLLAQAKVDREAAGKLRSLMERRLQAMDQVA